MTVEDLKGELEKDIDSLRDAVAAVGEKVESLRVDLAANTATVTVSRDTITAQMAALFAARDAQGQAISSLQRDAVTREEHKDLADEVNKIKISVGKLVVIIAVIAATIGGATGGAVQWLLKGLGG